MQGFIFPPSSQVKRTELVKNIFIFDAVLSVSNLSGILSPGFRSMRWSMVRLLRNGQLYSLR